MAKERDRFGFDHCQAGAWMMERMPFPPELCEVVVKHHQPPSGPFRMVHLVRIAGLLADTLGFAVHTAAHRPPFAEALQELPEAACLRFTTDPEELKTDIGARIQSWG